MAKINIIKSLGIDKIKGNWKNWGNFGIIIFLLCPFGIFLCLYVVNPMKYINNSKIFIVNSIPNTSENSTIFFPDSERLIFKGIMKNEEKYFVNQEYIIGKIGGFVYEKAEEKMYVALNIHELEKGNTKRDYIPVNAFISNKNLQKIEFIFDNTLETKSSFKMSDEFKNNSYYKNNVGHYLVFYKKYFGICLMDLIYYGFWLWVIWGVCYLFYVYILKENLDGG